MCIEREREREKERERERERERCIMLVSFSFAPLLSRLRAPPDLEIGRPRVCAL